MNPAKLTIQGDFWDCQIYRGRLYLWYTDGTLRVVDFTGLILSLVQNPWEELPLTCAFLNGRLLYASNMQVIFRDPALYQIVQQRIAWLVDTEIVIDQQRLEKFTIGTQDNPFKELQTDSEILSNQIYAVTYGGIFTSNAHRNKHLKYAVSTRKNKVHDFVAFSLRASRYGRIVLSGGDEGLYEFNNKASHYFYDDEYAEYSSTLRCISKRHSSFADYNFLSPYNSSLLGESFLSLHRWREDKSDMEKPWIIKEREISQNEIFKTNEDRGISWGTNEKIYMAVDNTLYVVNFNNSSKTEDFFSDKKSFVFQAWKGRILKGGISYFGTIVECENAIVVLKGNNDFYNIPGEITRWRVYPRSLNYENHLHVIFEDRLTIFSFNHDYFHDQLSKEFGIIYSKQDRDTANDSLVNFD